LVVGKIYEGNKRGSTDDSGTELFENLLANGRFG